MRSWFVLFLIYIWSPAFADTSPLVMITFESDYEEFFRIAGETTIRSLDQTEEVSRLLQMHADNLHYSPINTKEYFQEQEKLGKPVKYVATLRPTRHFNYKQSHLVIASQEYVNQHIRPLSFVRGLRVLRASDQYLGNLRMSSLRAVMLAASNGYPGADLQRIFKLMQRKSDGWIVRERLRSPIIRKRYFVTKRPFIF